MSKSPAIVPTNTMVVSGIDRVLTVQRPVVLAHIRSIRAGKPDAGPPEVIRILERRYLTAVTTGGAAVGAAAVVPGVGLVSSVALSAAETAGFLEASALFAQSITEVHGIPVDDPDRARTLVMTLVLGGAGSDLVRQLAGQASGGQARSAFWGETITKNLPKAAVGRIGDQIRKRFLKRFAVTATGSTIGRAIPFGIGAVVGGTGNNILGRQVIKGAREAFGPPPLAFPESLAPRERSPRIGGVGRLVSRLPGRKRPDTSAWPERHPQPPLPQLPPGSSSDENHLPESAAGSQG
jgi:hypothetical protein